MSTLDTETTALAVLSCSDRLTASVAPDDGYGGRAHQESCCPMYHLARVLMSVSLIFALGACAAAPEEGDLAEDGHGTAATELSLPPVFLGHSIRLHVIRTADSDGTNRSPTTLQDITDAVPVVNQIYAGTGIRFLFDPATDFETIDSTLLNQTFTLLDPNLENYPNEDDPPPTSNVAHNMVRRQFADAHRDKLTVFLHGASILVYEEGQWKLVLRGGGKSGDDARYVSMFGALDKKNFAHELGHYLHLQHTFVRGATDVPLAAAKIQDYVAAGNPPPKGLDALDGDLRYVNDTPPDAKGEIFEKVFGKGQKCGPEGEIPIPANIPGGPWIFMLAPDRGLVMSYFGCGDPYLSDDQATRSRESLELLNRASLIARKPSASPITLVQKDTAAGGGLIAQVQAARIGRRRLVTATTSSSNALKLVVWDVSASGVFTRRGEIDVATVAGPFAVTHGGLNQVLAAYRDTAGKLAIRSYAVDSHGELTLQDVEGAGAITDLAMVRVSSILFVTPVRMTSGVMRVVLWRLNANGELDRLADADGGPITMIEAASYLAVDDPGENLEAGVMTFARDGAGNLAVQSWEIDKAGQVWTVRAIDQAVAGATDEFAIAQVDFDLTAAVARTSSNQQKVVIWHTDYFGAITRRDDIVAGSCTRLAGAAIGVELLATACREAGTDALVMRLFQVSPGGQDVTTRATLPALDDVTDVVLVPVDNDKVVSAARTASGGLSLRSFAVATE